MQLSLSPQMTTHSDLVSSGSSKLRFLDAVCPLGLADIQQGLRKICRSPALLTTCWLWTAHFWLLTDREMNHLFFYFTVFFCFCHRSLAFIQTNTGSITKSLEFSVFSLVLYLKKTSQAKGLWNFINLAFSKVESMLLILSCIVQWSQKTLWRGAQRQEQMAWKKNQRELGFHSYSHCHFCFQIRKIIIISFWKFPSRLREANGYSERKKKKKVVLSGSPITTLFPVHWWDPPNIAGGIPLQLLPKPWLSGDNSDMAVCGRVLTELSRPKVKPLLPWVPHQQTET